MSNIKTSKIAYYDNTNIYEVKAFVLESDLSAYFESIRDINFEDNYHELKTLVPNHETEIVDGRDNIGRSMLKNSKEVKKELKNISNEKVMDFTRIDSLLKTNSMMNSPELIDALRKYVDMYKYELITQYSVDDVGSILRAIMKLGTTEDKKVHNALMISLDNNTDFLSKIGHETLVKHL